MGYTTYFKYKYFGLPKHLKEQVEYRAFLCKDDCAKQGYCIQCGCDFPARIFTSESCNKERFPDFKPGLEWEQFKEDKGIDE